MKTYRCGHCGYEGVCYGTPIFGGKKSGTSAPWCKQCGMNDKLAEIKKGCKECYYWVGDTAKPKKCYTGNCPAKQRDDFLGVSRWKRRNKSDQRKV